MRRLVFALSAIQLNDYVFLQILLQFVSSLGLIFFINWYQPFLHRKMSRLETFNEWTEIMLLYHLMMFTQWISDPIQRHKTGWSFIALICAYMLLHLSLMMYASVKDMIKKCKLRCQRRASRRAAKNKKLPRINKN